MHSLQGTHPDAVTTPLCIFLGKSGVVQERSSHPNQFEPVGEGTVYGPQRLDPPSNTKGSATEARMRRRSSTP